MAAAAAASFLATAAEAPTAGGCAAMICAGCAAPEVVASSKFAFSVRPAARAAASYAKAASTSPRAVASK
jgi:hypothetical protein